MSPVRSILIGASLTFVLLLVGRPLQAEQSKNRPAHYTVQDGDRLINLAKRFGVTVDAILEANGIVDARHVRSGQKLVIPGKGAAKRRPVRREEISYKVRSGDTLSEIADRFDIPMADIMEANDIDNPRGLRKGQELIIPPRGGMKKARGAKASASPGKGGKREKAWQRRARKLAEKLGLGSRHVANKLLRGQLERSWIRAAGRGRIPATLRFPVHGGIAGRGWGSGTGHYHLAFDIPGKMGARVSASAPGIVAYANDELAGYGKVVMIIHPGGLVTVYAHNSEFRTVPGERVKAGTRIALLGNSGISRGPHVHFELVYRGKLCDPVPLMRPVPKNGRGRPVVRKRELRVWPRSGGPPKGLNCAPRRRHPAYVGKPRGWRPKCWPNCPWDRGSDASDSEDVGSPEATPGGGDNGDVAPSPQKSAPAPEKTPE